MTSVSTAVYSAILLSGLAVACEKHPPGSARTGGVAQLRPDSPMRGSELFGQHQAPGVVQAVTNGMLVMRDSAPGGDVRMTRYVTRPGTQGLQHVRAGERALVHYHVADTLYVADSVSLIGP